MVDVKYKIVLIILSLGLLIHVAQKEPEMPVAVDLDEVIVDESEDLAEDTEITIVENVEEVEEEIEEIEEKLEMEGYSICIDAGHGISTDKRKEAIAPNSDKTKPAFVSGTRGLNQTEEQLNLIVAKKLEFKLKELGADVHMTRSEANTNMSNIDRAVFANDLNVDLVIRIHADGSSDPAANGISMLVPKNDHIQNEELIRESQRAGEIILAKVVEKTGGKNRGIIKHSEMTGFNWSKRPVILLEMGFMTNPAEDKLMESDDYQEKIVDGIIEGIREYRSE